MTKDYFKNIGLIGINPESLDPNLHLLRGFYKPSFHYSDAIDKHITINMPSFEELAAKALKKKKPIIR